LVALLVIEQAHTTTATLWPTRDYRTILGIYDHLNYYYVTIRDAQSFRQAIIFRAEFRQLSFVGNRSFFHLKAAREEEDVAEQ